MARAIIGRPQLLILDDPLSALDVHTEALVENALSRVLSGVPLGVSRERVRAALVSIGQPADARAERLAPQDFRDLAAALEQQPPQPRA